VAVIIILEDGAGSSDGEGAIIIIVTTTTTVAAAERAAGKEGAGKGGRSPRPRSSTFTSRGIGTISTTGRQARVGKALYYNVPTIANNTCGFFYMLYTCDLTGKT